MVWTKVEHEAFRGDKSYAPLFSLFSSKGIEEEFFILSVDGKNVGRAKVAVDMNWISKRHENVGFIDDFVIASEYRDHADALIQKCLLVLKEKEGIDEVLVRYNLPAMQYDSFDQVAVFPCSHTPSWYIDIFERNGFEIKKRWVAYRATMEGEFSVPKDESEKGGGLLDEHGWEIKRINMRNNDEMKQYTELFYGAFIEHFGWNPAGVADISEGSSSGIERFLSGVIMRLVRFELWGVFDKDKKLVAFAVVHPEYNEVMNASLKGNKLLRLPKLLINLRRAKMCTIDGIALSKELRGFGFAKTIAPLALDFGMNKLGYRAFDGIILLDNIPSLRTAQPLIDRYVKRFGVNFNVTEMNYVTMAYRFDSGDL